MIACRLIECIFYEIFSEKKAVSIWGRWILINNRHPTIKKVVYLPHPLLLISTWFEHATSWSGVRRATIAPRNLLYFLTIHFLVLHFYPRWNHVSMKCKILIVINFFLNTSARNCKHRWFSGRMLACHVGGPGSIPGRCILALLEHMFRWNPLFEISLDKSHSILPYSWR